MILFDDNALAFQIWQFTHTHKELVIFAYGMGMYLIGMWVGNVNGKRKR